MGTFSIWHWLAVLAIALVIFGTKRLRNLGGDLGASISSFKNAMKEENNKEEVVGVRATEKSTDATT